MAVRDSDRLLAAGLSDEAQQLEFLKKMGMSLDDARPSGAQIMKALKYFDLAVKFEVVLVSDLLKSFNLLWRQQQTSWRFSACSG